jgi:tetratricopeptide (TPR) repeat protein
VRDEVARYPTDPFALQLLGEVEYAQGNFAQAEAAADRMLAVRPNDRGGITLKSMLLSRRSASLSGDARKAMVGQARDMAVKANRSDPDDPRPLLAYYQSYNLSGETPPVVAVQGLMQAVSLLPRENAPRQLLVDELARERRFDEAIAWLMPVANSPHRSPRREKARQQMEQLKAAKAAAGKQAATSG